MRPEAKTPDKSRLGRCREPGSRRAAGPPEGRGASSRGSRARLGEVWRAVGWERQGPQNLTWALGLEPGSEEAVRLTVAKFGSDPKEGMLSVRGPLEPQPIAGWLPVPPRGPLQQISECLWP